MSDATTDAAIDFFISYTKVDLQWAEWFAWQLDKLGFKVFFDKWHILPGQNFALELQTAARNARHTVIVLSPEYLQSEYAAAEWAAAFRRDPTGTKRALIPIMVRHCELEGLLASISYGDATAGGPKDVLRLLEQATGKLSPRPQRAPVFPRSHEPAFPVRVDPADAISDGVRSPQHRSLGVRLLAKDEDSRSLLRSRVAAELSLSLGYSEPVGAGAIFFAQHRTERKSLQLRIVGDATDLPEPASTPNMASTERELRCVLTLSSSALETQGALTKGTDSRGSLWLTAADFIGELRDEVIVASDRAIAAVQRSLELPELERPNSEAQLLVHESGFYWLICWNGSQAALVDAEGALCSGSEVESVLDELSLPDREPVALDYLNRRLAAASSNRSIGC